MLTPAETRDRASRLSPYFSERLGRSVTVTSVSLASDGMSALTMILTLGESEEIVVRVRTGLADSEAVEELQLRVLEAARAAGVDAPEPLFFDLDPSVLGGPLLVTRRLPGKPVTPWSRPGRAFLAEAGRGEAGAQLMPILADIHRAVIPPDLQVDAREATKKVVAAVRERVESFASGPEPILYDALGFLAQRIPHVEEPVLVHGDYRAGNFLFEGHRITGILDWELAHIGDPAEDLAWLMSKANRASSDLACDMVPMDGVITAYEKASGRTIDPAAVAYWEVYLLAKLTSYWLFTSALWRKGELEDVRTARWTYNIPRLRAMTLDALERADP